MSLTTSLTFRLGLLSLLLSALAGLGMPSCGGDADADNGASTEPPAEVCDNEVDDDLDELADCEDPDCWVEDGLCEELCDSGDDEDGDGAAACEDSDCWVEGGECAEVCEGGADEDGDGDVDCDDEDCWVEGGSCSEVCDLLTPEDGGDEDGDGDVDCEDADCWVEGGGCPELCEGGEDEDGDGDVDCDDEDDCRLDVLCAPSYEDDIQPIFLNHCSGDGVSCHTGDIPQGGWNVDTYDTTQNNSYYCDGGPYDEDTQAALDSIPFLSSSEQLSKGQCTIVRITEGSMPIDDAVSLEDQATISYWVEAGTPP